MPIPDYLLDLDEATILARLLETVPAGVDKSPGSFIYDALSPAAIELAELNERARLVLEWGFAGTSFGEFLDLRAEEHGLLRRPPVAAQVAEQEITGDDGTVIPQGTEFYTPSAGDVETQVFLSDAEVVIAAGVAVVALTAQVPGAAGNVAVGAISQVEEIAGVAGTSNLTEGVGGLDEETDSELLTRYYLRVRNPGTSGNRADYVNWALEVPGVGGAAVVPLEDGPGTVTVAIVDVDMQPAGAPLVALVQAYIAPDGPDGGGKAPIGADATIEAATAVVVEVGADLTVSPGYVEADVQAAAEESIAAYLRSIAFSADNDVLISRVIAAVLEVPGVADVEDVTLEGAGANVVVGVKEVATLGVVTWS